MEQGVQVALSSLWVFDEISFTRDTLDFIERTMVFQKLHAWEGVIWYNGWSTIISVSPVAEISQ